VNRLCDDGGSRLQLVAMVLDTLKVARRLREAGFTEPQAEAIVEAVREGGEDADFATKHDLSLLAAELRAEMAAIRSEMREMEQRSIARLEATKAELVSRMFGMIVGALLVNIVAMLGAMFAFAKLLGH
jgi:DNA-binding transcriptional MerR regulator